MAKKRIRLGDEIEDVTSKTIGIAIGRVEYLSGQIYWIIQPATTDDNMPIKTYEVQDNYCKWHGDGVYPSTKPPMGFRADEQA
jgi:hypothetical protein